MKQLKYLLACFLFLALAQTAHAQLSGLGQSICGALFPTSGGVGFPNSLIITAGSNPYSTLVQISMTIVLAVLTVLGVIWGFGYAFGLESLKLFSRTELAEGVFSMVMIIFIAGGLGFAGNISTVISNIGYVAVGSVVTGPTPPPFSFYNLCANYMTYGVETDIGGLLNLAGSYYLWSLQQSIVISIIPNNFGFAIAPWAGINPQMQVLNTELGIYMGIGGLLAGVGMLMFVIYYLFPVFLYVGVLLRSTPWTRAAGGSMIALFVAMYVIFPSLLYPFSVFSIPVPPPTGCASLLTLDPSSLQNTQIGCFTQNFLVDQVQGFVQSISFSLLQLFGVIVAFLISFDLIEQLGDLLGAPSLQSGKLLSRVI